MATSPFGYPIGSPTISGNSITVDTMLNEPTRITRALADLSLRRMFAQRIFSTPGGVEGGALLYDVLTSNDLFLDSTREVQNVEPGAEFPIVTSSRSAPSIARVEKFGGKFFVTDEARARNDETQVRNGTMRLSNSISKGVDARAIAALDAAVTTYSRTATGVNWATANSTVASSLTKNIEPGADFAAAQLTADTDELGVQFDLWIVNPAQYAALSKFYGVANLAGVLDAYGVEVLSSNRVTAGTAYAVESGVVGEMRFEQGLVTETWREQATERTWVQSSIRPVFAVTNPYSVIKFSGLAG
jgi:hypothetical protein